MDQEMQDRCERAERALAELLGYVDRDTCLHEHRVRGGAIWTICEECGEKWADDQGGFKPHQDAAPVAKARAIVAALREKQVAALVRPENKHDFS